MPEQSHAVIGSACFDSDDPELGAAHRSCRQDVRPRVDPVGQAAWFAGQVQLECFGRRFRRRGGVAPSSLQHSSAGEGEEDDRGVAQPAGEVQSPVVRDLGTSSVAV